MATMKLALSALPDDIFLHIIDGTGHPYPGWYQRAPKGRKLHPQWFLIIQASKALALKMWGNDALWRVLDFGFHLGARSNATMMTDFHLDALLRRINAREVTQHLDLRIGGYHSCKLDGSGLAPLKDSRVLSTVDLRAKFTNDGGNSDDRLDAKFIASILITMIGEGGALKTILFNDKSLDNVSGMKSVRDLMLGFDEDDRADEEEFIDCNNCGIKESMELGGSFCDKCAKEFCNDCAGQAVFCNKCFQTICGDCGTVQFCEKCFQYFCGDCETLGYCERSLSSYCARCGPGNAGSEEPCNVQ